MVFSLVTEGLLNYSGLVTGGLDQGVLVPGAPGLVAGGLLTYSALVTGGLDQGIPVSVILDSVAILMGF